MKLDELINLAGNPYTIRIDGASELTLTHLMNLAQKALDDTPPATGMQDVTVLITSQDNIYTGTTGDTLWGEALIQQLKSQQDTQVTHLVSLLRSYTDTTGLRQGPDVPSFNFRKKLLELDEKNAFALLVMQGFDCLRARTIGSTMPKTKSDK